MAIYRVYLRDQFDQISAREDFEAHNDIDALRVAEELCDARSDICARFEVYQGTRHIRGRTQRTVEQLAERLEEVVIHTEEMLQRGLWATSSSRRLLERLDYYKGRRS